MYRSFFYIVLVVLLLSCKYEPLNLQLAGAVAKADMADDRSALVKESLFVNKNSLSFLVIGDFGIHGKGPQRAVANAMGAVADKLNASFIVSTGDNFYPNGVTSVKDEGWTTSFENVYTAPSLQKDWYVVLGNHDYKGNIQAQVSYSSLHTRWHMPAPYFSKIFAINGDTANQLLMVFVDTNPLSPSYYNSGAYQKNVQLQDSLAQKKWLKAVLQQDTAHIRWRIVVGHHPLFTGGHYKKDRSVQEIKASLQPLLDEFGIDAYISGHDHGLQCIKPEGRTHYFISAGGSGHYDKVSLYPQYGRFAAATTGFMAFSLTKNELLVQVVDSSSKVLYKEIITK